MPTDGTPPSPAGDDDESPAVPPADPVPQISPYDPDDYALDVSIRKSEELEKRDDS